MSISLVKGQKIDLTKGNAKLKKVVFALGWDTNRYDGDEEFDLDVSAFFTDDSGKVTGEHDFVFYGQPQHPSGALTYSGDNRTFLQIFPKSVSLQQFMMRKIDCRTSVWLIIHISEHTMQIRMRSFSDTI